MSYCNLSTGSLKKKYNIGVQLYHYNTENEM
jgi:hypothetical protein